MKITDVDEPIIAVRRSQYPTNHQKEFLLVGRSNVGKSSFINTLLNRKNLAHTSSHPGKTQTLNFYHINNEFYLIDVPGYGYAKRGRYEVEKLKKLINYYVLQRQQLTCLFVLIDSRLEPQKIDLEFIRFLGENGVPFGIIFTKADKPKRGELKKNVERFLQTLHEEWEELPPYFITSSDTGLGRDEFLDYIEQINQSLK